MGIFKVELVRVLHPRGGPQDMRGAFLAPEVQPPDALCASLSVDHQLRESPMSSSPIPAPMASQIKGYGLRMARIHKARRATTVPVPVICEEKEE